MSIRRIVVAVLTPALVATMGLAGTRLWQTQRGYAQEARLHEQLLAYRPGAETDPASSGPASSTPPAPPAPGGAPSAIAALQAAYPQAVGWLSVPGTAVDYPLAQADDNDYYLHTDLAGQPAPAGTLFLDHRNSPDFGDVNTLIFGHHMKNGSMFGSLQRFADRGFFEAHDVAWVVLADGAHRIDLMAFAVIAPDDRTIYDVPTADPEAFLAQVQDAARYWRDLGAAAGDRFVTLSTCNYEFRGARMVLIGVLRDAAEGVTTP